MKQSTSKKSRENTAFLYPRLSRDDNLEGESYSIQNQKKLLTKAAKDILHHHRQPHHRAAAYRRFRL